MLLAIEGDLEALAFELDRDPNLVHARSASPFEATLLHYAAAANGVEDELQRTPPNAVEIVRLLLDRGADPDGLSTSYGGGENQTPLCLLVSSWHPFQAGVQAGLVELLVERGARVDGLGDDGMPLATALVFGYTGAAEALARSGARVDNVFFAAGLGDLERVLTFFTSEGELKRSAAGSFVSPTLGAREIEPSEALQEALHFAVTHGRLEVAEALVERGASVNGVSRGHHRERPLEQAAFVQERAAVAWLEAKGAVFTEPPVT